jgi:Tfp pilus assembly protein PilF
MGPAQMSTDSSLRVRNADVASPYENARPGVAYVGDVTCARCHQDIASAYRAHPMGRSLAPVSGRETGPWTSASAGLSIEDKGVQFTIEHNGGRVFHKASRRGADGNSFAEIEAEVSYALGSGTRGISFLIERDGFLFQSPVAWFAQERRWDISPGYGEFSTRPDFERAIQPDCLFCHANHFQAVPGTVNRYEKPIFQGHAIGCERCHGPGELHVNRRAGLSSEPDMSIVNPAHLTPALRDSVCQQCHLQGSFRFARAGRDPFDFRPGLPLHRFLAVFLMKKGSGGKLEAVGHDEQMEASRCFAASKGELGCISCHDPHRLPAPAAKVAYYRERCLACHEKKGCALSLSQRQTRGQGDDCIACHMPRPAITNVPHTAATDHRILRDARGPKRENPRDASGQPGESPLVDYHWRLMTEEERQDAARDMGVAHGWAARGLKGSPLVAKIAAMQGLALLEAAVRDRPDDMPAREFLGHTFEILGRREDALNAFKAALRVEPARELALRSAGRLLVSLQRPELARAEFQKAIEVNPWRSHYRLALAGACYQAGDWPGAVAACRDALRLNPELFEARSLLVQCYLRSHDPGKADAEFGDLLRFYPASREVWQQWYEQQKQAGPRASGVVTTGEP